jgi:hypothetical protein
MADSLHESVLDSLAATLATALPSDIPAERIYKQLAEDRTNIKHPCIVLLLDGVRETCEAFSSEEDERVLPVQVHVMDSKDRKEPTWLAPWLARRQAIIDALLMQVPEDITGVWDVKVEPTSVIDGMRLLGKSYEDSRGGFTIRAKITTARRRAS